MFKDLESTGRPIAERTRQTARTLEGYMEASARPRWMERILEIDRSVARERALLAAEYEALLRECGGDRRRLARRWREVAAGWDFSALNALIRTHNESYPVERDLPMDPRTGEFRPVHGRSHRRPELTPEWALAQFPPSLDPPPVG